MTLRDYLNIIRDRMAIIMATVLVVSSVALIFSYRQVPQYEATARMRVAPLGAGTEAAGVLERLLDSRVNVLTEAELVRSTPIARRVIARHSLDESPEQLLRDIRVHNPAHTEVLEITATAIDREVARDLANGFAEAYIEHRRDRAISDATDLLQNIGDRLRGAQDRLAALDDQMSLLTRESAQWEVLNQDRFRLAGELAALQDQYDKLLDPQALRAGGGEVIQHAAIPDKAASPNHVRNGILGLLVSLPLAIGLTLLRDSLSDTVKTKEEAEQLTGAETLALVPHDADWRRPAEPWLASIEEPSSIVAESYRTLRINMEFTRTRQKNRYVLVTSPGRGEGKSATVANLGVAFAEAGRQTVVVSADLRRPRLHEFLGTEMQPGLAEALKGSGNGNGNGNGRGGNRWLRSVSPNLWAVPSGQPDERVELRINRRDMESLFGKLPSAAGRPAAGARRSAEAGTRSGTGSARARGSTAADMVLLDAPAILRASEVSSLASAVDGVVLVLHAGITRRVAATRAAEQIRKVGGKILGIALVGVRNEDQYDGEEDGERRADGIVGRTWDRVFEGLRR